MDNIDIILGLRFIIDRIYFDGFNCTDTSELSSSDLFELEVLRDAIKFIQDNSK